MSRKFSVEHTFEFERVRDLPRRVISLEDATLKAEILTKELALPGGKMALRPWQGLALWEALENRGAFLALPVGQGKELVCAVLPVLFNAKKPLLVLPAGLRDTQWPADYARYGKHFRTTRQPYRAIGREELALDQNHTFLEDYAPDLIVINEGHRLAHHDSGAVRKLDRYIADHPDVVVVLMTGTPSRESPLRYWHQLCWCLKERAPMPLTMAEASLWASALSLKVRDESKRTRPGPLGRTREEAVEWFAARLRETPGVLLVDEDSCTVPLTLRWRPAREDAALNEHYRVFLKNFKNPGGIFVSDPRVRWLLDAQMGCDLYTVWNPPPPDDWREARREFAKFVRDRILYSTNTAHPLDTEMQVSRKYANHPIVANWKALKDTFKGETQTVWIGDSTIQSCLDWLEEVHAAGERGIVWCGIIDFAERLAATARLPYYGAKGLSRDGVSLNNADPKRSLIASWCANKEGFNLQAWHRALIVSPPQSAEWLEQLIGRLHRAGQLSPVVIDILLTSGGTIDAFESAVREALFAKSTVTLTQKILRAKIERVRPRITPANHYRWATRTKVD